MKYLCRLTDEKGITHKIFYKEANNKKEVKEVLDRFDWEAPKNAKWEISVMTENTKEIYSYSQN